MTSSNGLLVKPIIRRHSTRGRRFKDSLNFMRSGELGEFSRKKEICENDKGSDDDEHTRQATPCQVLRFLGTICSSRYYGFLFSKLNRFLSFLILVSDSVEAT